MRDDGVLSTLRRAFTEPPLTDLHTQSWLLWGASCTRRTAFAMRHGKHPYLIQNIEQLATIPDECDLLVFDDVRFVHAPSHMTPKQMISLLDVTQQARIKGRYYDIVVPSIPRIFTTTLRRQHPFLTGDTPEEQLVMHRYFSERRAGRMYTALSIWYLTCRAVVCAVTDCGSVVSCRW